MLTTVYRDISLDGDNAAVSIVEERISVPDKLVVPSNLPPFQISNADPLLVVMVLLLLHSKIFPLLEYDAHSRVDDGSSSGGNRIIVILTKMRADDKKGCHGCKHCRYTSDRPA